jgi:hypothetical protein
LTRSERLRGYGALEVIRSSIEQVNTMWADRLYIGAIILSFVVMTIVVRLVTL